MVENLDQLLARSTREIEAHVTELGLLEAGRYFIEQPAQLLAAMRLWAQSQCRSDQVVREILQDLDRTALEDAARELREMGTPDAKAAAWTVALNTNRSSEELMAIASYALRAL
jgi:hypothetical protein